MIFLLIKFSITFGGDMFFQIERVYILYDNNLGGMFSYIYKNIYLWISVLQICIQHSLISEAAIMWYIKRVKFM